MNRIARIGAVLLTIAVLAGAAAAAEQKIINVVPADSLFYGQMSNFDFTLSQLDQYMAGVIPPLGVQSAVQMGLGEILGTASLEGVNTSGAIAIFAKAGSSGEVGDEMITIVVPVSDYKKLLSASTTIEKPDSNGISAIQGEGGLITQVGNFAFVKSPDAYKDLLELKKTVQAAGFKSLAATLDSAAISQIAAPAWIYCNMPQVQKTFGPQISAAFDEMKKAVGQIPPGALGTTGNITEILNIYFDFIKGFMTQSKYIGISIKPTPDNLTISLAAAGLPGTKMAEMLTSAPSVGPNKLLAYLPNGAMFNYTGAATGKLNSEVTKYFADWLSKATTPEKAAKITAIINDMSSIFNGSEAVTASVDPNGKPPFSESLVSEISDKDKLNKVIDQAAELINSGIVNDFYKSLGIPLQLNMTVKRGVENYNNTSIDSAVLSFKFPDSNAPEAAMLKQIYGDGITYRWAIVNNLFVCAIGSNNVPNLKKLIDQAKAGGTTQVSSQVKEAMSILPGSDKAAFIATFNIVRCLDFLPAVIPMMPKMNIPTNSNLAIDGKIGSGSATIDIALPKAHLTEIMQVVNLFMSGGVPITSLEQSGAVQPQQLKVPKQTKPADANVKN